MIQQREDRCLIRSNKKVQSCINKHFKKYDIVAKDIVEKARKQGLSFNESALSIYRNHGHAKNGLSATDVLWICKQFKIRLSLDIKYFG